MKYHYRLIILLFLITILGMACTSTETPTRTEILQPTQILAATIVATPTTVPLPTNTPVPTVIPTTVPSPTNTPVPTVIPTAVPSPVPPTATQQSILFGDEFYAVVNVAADDVLNVRASAGVSAKIVGTMPYFAHHVKIAESESAMVGESQWVLAQYADVTGWVNRRYLARQIGTADDSIAARAAEIIFAIKSNNVTVLSTMVHPEKGVRFSPYTFVSDDDLVFSADDLPLLFASSDTHLWGYFAGSGETIEMSGAEYWARFIYDADFAQPEIIGFNQQAGQGNTINNIAEVYPDGVFVEYHFSGFDPNFAGMDWRSLRLVLENYQGQWFLVGIVHDEWTI